MTRPDPPLAGGPTFGGIGFAAGVLGGLLGVGGGFILVPLQVVVGRMGQRRAQATSLAAIVPGAAVAVLVYWFGAARPQVDLRFALLIVIGSAAGAYVGARLMSHLPDHVLRIGFAVLLAVLGLKELIAP